MSFPDIDKLKDVIVVRVTASEWRYGKWQFAYDDPVLLFGLDAAIKELIARGIDRISLHVLGRYGDIHAMDWKPKSGTKQMNSERKNHKLDEYHV